MYFSYLLQVGGRVLKEGDRLLKNNDKGAYTLLFRRETC